MKRCRMAIIGCGDIARFTALGCLLNRKMKAVACMDIDGERSRAFARRFRIPNAYDDFDTLLGRDDLDAVYLAVPHNLHRPMIEKAIARGLPVLCEKPVAADMDDAVAICELSQKSKIPVGINYQYRYDSACYALVEACREGALGEGRYGRVNVPWNRKRTYFDGSPWHKSMAHSGGGTLLTQASHVIDIALSALGGRPVTAMGMTGRKVFTDVEVEDFGTGLIEMEGGAVLSVTSSMVAVPERKILMEIYGSGGTVTYEGPDFPKVRFYGTKVTKRRPPIRGVHALFRSIEGFRRWITGGEQYLTPAASALSVLAAVKALYRSAESGKREPVDDRYVKYI
ncbi:MAG: Gfo/Idh/MocA family oxidoreductase [Deltaproteobacteria bacterium]|nr:Gfo/Idh/MocA family oxidoreductase [Candidatus Zymogenaceae bacterium]